MVTQGLCRLHRPGFWVLTHLLNYSTDSDPDGLRIHKGKCLWNSLLVSMTSINSSQYKLHTSIFQLLCICFNNMQSLICPQALLQAFSPRLVAHASQDNSCPRGYLPSLVCNRTTIPDRFKPQVRHSFLETPQQCTFLNRELSWSPFFSSSPNVSLSIK